MTRVGLTGGIAAGKSTAAARLAALGAVVIDYDELARDVVAPGTTGLAAIVDRFGPAIAPGGRLDRSTLGRIVFADPGARAELNAIVHPLVRLRAMHLEEGAPAGSLVVHDIPLLAEGDTDRAFDHVVTVEADENVRLARLTGLRGMTETDARARIGAQASDDERREIADTVLDANRPLDAFLADVDDLYARLTAR